ncbi:auxin-induced protein 22D [Ricinus communis]|uniref:Auxin-responsive protein n=1 Tax=Ricinus communis TaxID=3988 RepID=B9SZ70_RICCO|nr:auxin-induced protein 22D [Ricinus communis]EEF31102.1 Auxin-induced protein 22D, putative [Ricinus communis]|eukprot:XP_002531289.1 auxin-induced protein 22D [Ricinus communis]
MAFERDGDLNLEATELRLALPGTTAATEESHVTAKCNKRSFPDMNDDRSESRNNSNVSNDKKGDQETTSPPTKAQVVGWPPVRSYRKNCFQARKTEAEAAGNGIYVKVSMDGAPYLRKIDLKVYKCYTELFQALEDMFKFKVGKFSEREGYNGSEFVPTYEDKDGDWMLVGDVPWDMFINSCKRLRIMKGSEARGLGCAV